MKTHEIIKQLREKAGLSQQELAEMVGYKDRSSIAKVEAGLVDLSRTKIEAFAKAFNVNPASLIDIPVNVPVGMEPMVSLEIRPLAGLIACGEPLLAEQNIEEYVQVPTMAHCDFVLRCKGDSMKDARINDGDLAFIRIQPTVENGEIAAVRIGDECTLKRFQKTGDMVILMPCNSAYQPMVFQGKEIADIHIEGKLVGFMSLNVR